MGFFPFTIRNKRNICSKMVNSDYSGIISSHYQHLKNLWQLWWIYTLRVELWHTDTQYRVGNDTDTICTIYIILHMTIKQTLNMYHSSTFKIKKYKLYKLTTIQMIRLTNCYINNYYSEKLTVIKCN